MFGEEKADEPCPKTQQNKSIRVVAQQSAQQQTSAIYKYYRSHLLDPLLDPILYPARRGKTGTIYGTPDASHTPCVPAVYNCEHW